LVTLWVSTSRKFRMRVKITECPLPRAFSFGRSTALGLEPLHCRAPKSVRAFDWCDVKRKQGLCVETGVAESEVLRCFGAAGRATPCMMHTLVCMGTSALVSCTVNKRPCLKHSKQEFLYTLFGTDVQLWTSCVAGTQGVHLQEATQEELATPAWFPSRRHLSPHPLYHYPLMLSLHPPQHLQHTSLQHTSPHKC